MKLSDLPDIPPGGLYRGLVYHWSAGRYRTYFEHYNVCVLGPRPDGAGDGQVLVTHPFLNNLRRITDGPYASHTRRRNSGRIGISAMCMYGATPDDYGEYPPTPKQIEAMCAVGGLVVAKYGMGIPLEEQVATHHQWAVEDGYYPERWNWMREAARLIGKTGYYARLYGWRLAA